MVNFKVNGRNGNYELNLPSSLKEITREYLEAVTDSISVAENYSLIGICYREKLSAVIFANNTKKNSISTSVVSIFVKAGKCDSSFINSIRTCDKLIISGSDIAMGHHVVAPKNVITIDNILSIVEGDSTLYKQSLKEDKYCYFLEFKLVPNCNIHGYYDESNNTEVDNTFVTKVD